MKCVSNLPDWNNRQDWRQWSNRRRISTHNGDDLIAVHLQARMETDDDVVGEHTLWILLCSASLERKLNLVAHVAFADDLAGAVTVEVGVGDAVKLLVEFQIHLCEKKSTFTVTICSKTLFLLLLPNTHTRDGKKVCAHVHVT